jgi:hypothetical protein
LNTNESVRETWTSDNDDGFRIWLFFA